jgi:hypothetical protein
MEVNTGTSATGSVRATIVAATAAVSVVCRWFVKLLCNARGPEGGVGLSPSERIILYLEQ